MGKKQTNHALEARLEETLLDELETLLLVVAVADGRRAHRETLHGKGLGVVGLRVENVLRRLERLGPRLLLVVVAKHAEEIRLALREIVQRHRAHWVGLFVSDVFWFLCLFYSSERGVKDEGKKEKITQKQQQKKGQKKRD